LTDKLPDGVTYVSDDANDTGTDYNATTGVWEIGTLDVGESIVLHIQAQVESAGTITNYTTAAQSNNEDNSTAGDDLNETITVTQIEVTISDANATEGEDLVFDVNISEAVATDTNITITTTNGTAGSDDYTEVSTTVVIPAGETGIVVTVSSLEDSIDEEDETFTITATLGSSSDSGVGTIIDDDADTDTEATVDSGGSTDTDGDGIIDYLDLDDDNDGILDADEGCGAELPEDLFWPAFHANIINAPGHVFVTGQTMNPDGVNDITRFTEVIAGAPINTWNDDGDPDGDNVWPDFAGTAIKAVASTDDQRYQQNILWTTEKLYVWASEGAILPDTVTSGTAMQEFALPSGVSISDIADIKSGVGIFGIRTISGELWLIGSGKRTVDGSAQYDSNIYGDGSTSVDDQWHLVKDSDGNTLTGVVDFELSAPAAVALTSDGSLYTWGEKTYLGDGSAVSARSTATKMTLHSDFNGIAPLQIELSVGYDEDDYTPPSYLLLHPNGQVYTMGDNSSGVLADGTTEERTTWDTVKTAAGTVLTDVFYLAGQNASSYYASAGAIVRGDDGKSLLYLWGHNSQYTITDALSDPQLYAGQPSFDFTTYQDTTGDGTVDGEDLEPIRLGIGGHVTVYYDFKQDKFAFVGHNARGSFGTENVNDAAKFSVTDDMQFDMTPDRDTDLDGVPDCHDIDSDNDGISDLIESGQDQPVVDTDNNGILDSTTDEDQDGIMDTADG